MRISHTKIKSNDLLFYIAFGLYLTTGILYRSFYYQYFSSVYSLIKYFCIILLIVKELMTQKFSTKSILIGFLFAVLIFVTRSQSSVATFAYTFIFIFCARNIDFKGIIKFSAWLSLTVVLFIVASSYLGIIEDYIYYEPTRVRHYLGFRYSLYGPTLLFYITGLFIYLKKGSIKWVSLIALLALNCWMFIMSRSRLSFGLSLLIILVDGFLKLYPTFFDRKRIVCMIMVFSFVICFAVSMIFTVAYNPSVSWQRQLNSILENRFSLGKSALQTYGISLFGQELKLVGNGLNEYGEKNTTDTYNYVDSYYEQTLLRYGIVFTVIFFGMLTYTLYYFYKKGDYWLLLYLTFIAGHCILEATVDIFYCSYWAAISVALFHSRKKEGNNKVISEKIS